MRRARVVSIALGVVSIGAALAVARRPVVTDARARAEQLTDAAADRLLALDYSAALALFENALRADPSYTPAAFFIDDRLIGDDGSASAIAFIDSIAGVVAD